MSTPEHQSPDSNRARALIAIGAMVGLAILIGVIVLTGGSDEREFDEAPAECVDSWNADEEATRRGVHNYLAHNYTSVQVAYSDVEATEVSSTPITGGGCVVIFAAQALDPEPYAAAEINLSGTWTAMSNEAELNRLGQLQSDALVDANAQLADDGSIAPLDS